MTFLFLPQKRYTVKVTENLLPYLDVRLLVHSRISGLSTMTGRYRWRRLKRRSESVRESGILAVGRMNLEPTRERRESFSSLVLFPKRCWHIRSRARALSLGLRGGTFIKPENGSKTMQPG